MKLITSRICGDETTFGNYRFPTVDIDLETHVYDEETDTETDEIDYDAVQMYYDDTMSEAKRVAEKFNIDFADKDRGRIYRSNSSRPFVVVFSDNDGYDCQLGIDVYDNPDWFPEEDENGELGISAYLEMDQWCEDYCDFVDYLSSSENGEWVWSKS